MNATTTITTKVAGVTPNVAMRPAVDVSANASSRSVGTRQMPTNRGAVTNTTAAAGASAAGG